MKNHKYVTFILILLIICFLTLYLSQETGYYDYEQHKKTTLTTEAIKKFEQDVKEGKNIDIKDYLENPKKNYNNKVARTGLTISKVIEKGVGYGLKGTMKILNKLLSD